MAVAKDLFLYNVAVTVIMKNEAPYAKEWLDFHIVAGVDHFFIYDNGSPDNLKEVLQPYIDADIVTYKFYPGTARQYEAYNDAIKNYRFFCRYMAFIDADEFIFPQKDKNIVEVLDETLDGNLMAGGLAVNLLAYGSNNLEKADYTKGVLERFTRRAPVDWVPLIGKDQNYPGGSAHIKTIANPRRINFWGHPHFAQYFEGFAAFNSNGGEVPYFYNDPPIVDKICINHYPVKSKEEYLIKISRGTADNPRNIYSMEKFERDDHNEVFDDSIFKYFNTHRVLPLEPVPDRLRRIFNATLRTLAPTFGREVSMTIFEGNLEDFLACRRVAAYLREQAFDKVVGDSFEEISLVAINKALTASLTRIDLRLIISELPSLMPLNYPVVEDIRQNCLRIIPIFMDTFKMPAIQNWREFNQLQYILDMLKAFEPKKL